MADSSSSATQRWSSFQDMGAADRRSQEGPVTILSSSPNSVCFFGDCGRFFCFSAGLEGERGGGVEKKKGKIV